MPYDPKLPPYSDSWSDLEISDFRPGDDGTHEAVLKVTRQQTPNTGPEYRFVRRWRKEGGVIRAEVALMRDPEAEKWLLDGVQGLARRITG